MSRQTGRVHLCSLLLCVGVATTERACWSNMLFLASQMMNQFVEMINREAVWWTWVSCSRAVYRSDSICFGIMTKYVCVCVVVRVCGCVCVCVFVHVCVCVSDHRSPTWRMILTGIQLNSTTERAMCPRITSIYEPMREYTHTCPVQSWHTRIFHSLS